MTTVCQPVVNMIVANFILFFFFNCMFYEYLLVQHSCSSIQSRGSELPSIVMTRDQNSRGCPLLFLNRNLLCIGDRNHIQP